jgi:hypothetical protein
MAQSSALRREDANPAPTPITIDGNLVPVPKNATIDNDGSVTFNAAQPCWLYFSPVGVFGDSQGLLKLVKGPNPPCSPQQENVTVTYSVTDPGKAGTPAPASGSSTKAGGHQIMNGGNTIKVG